MPGREYSFTFTYAHTGAGPKEPFSPRIYTNNKSEFADTIRVGRLPASLDWATNTIKFVATQNQSAHDYLIIHAYEVSGIVLANCTLSENLKTPFLRSDTTLCIGDELLLQAPVNRFYTYQWSTGETTPAITVTEPGVYSVEVALPICSSTHDEVEVSFIDCTVYMEMPNVFTPNDDNYNSMFKPIKFNYLESGSMKILNRWGKQVFAGDLFIGWDGLILSDEASTGVYYWEINYIDKNGEAHNQKGFMQLLR
jgi:gliding motility-associated-like protein